MRKAIAVGLICLAASLAFAAAGKIEPLKAKTGLWQMTQTIKWTGLPPQYQSLMQSVNPTMTYKSCVRAKDLNTNPWANGSSEKCQWTALDSNGTDMHVQGTSCVAKRGNNGLTVNNFNGRIHMLDSEHGEGNFDVTMTFEGQTAHGHATYTGKRIGATCPADMN